MTQITQNNCNINALRPLEVSCSPTNASSPESQDGAIQLYINGGTSPYTVSWTNGAQGTYIRDLQSGNYTATITDYYGDYTKTITCTVGEDTFYLDEFIKCADSFNPNIYVFYDGTSLNVNSAAQASESVRSWYQTKKDNGFGGLLYEGVIGKYTKNGENWLWWATYPYLGSLTGGTLSDGTVIRSFGLTGDSVENSVFNSSYCQSNDSGKCVPRNASFNFSTTTATGQIGDIYKRINNGFSLTGAYGTNDTRSMGVPFTVTSAMDGNGDSVYGDFIGGDTEYICIIIADESDGVVGLYHGKTNEVNGEPNKNFLYTNPFELYGTGWDDNTLKEPSNRYTYDYESFIKVWEDIKNQGGDFNGFIYPVINSSDGRIPFIQHTLGTIEGTTITDVNFETKYGESITNVGPESLNLSALTHTNVYSAMTTTEAYQNLNPTYQNGAGLKNFDWQVDPTVTGFEGGVIGDALNEYFTNISLSNDKIYTETIDNLVEDKIYKFSGITGCYSYEQRLLSTGQSYSGLTTTNVYEECIKCQPSTSNNGFQPTLCFNSGNNQYQFNPIGVDSNNYFVWENSHNSLTLSYNLNLNRWEITPWTNVGVGAMVRSINEAIPTGDFTNLGNPQPTIWTMTEGTCEGIPLTLNSATSDESCRGSGNGSVVLTSEGGSSPYRYRIQNVSPYPSYSTSGIFNNLSSGNYLGESIDDNDNTTTTTFSINEGDIPTQYNVSLTFSIVSTTSQTITWNYAVQVTPSLSSNVVLEMDLELKHIRKYRDSGSATFAQTFNITKNGTLNIPYTTSTTTTSSVPTSCTIETVNEITEIFTQTATQLEFSSGDSISGTVTQTANIDAENSFCNQHCRMNLEYNTLLQINNLTISGTNCDGAEFSNIPIGATNSASDCFEPQP